MHHSIKSLKKASLALDKEKEDAEKHLRKIIKEIVRRKIIRRKVDQALCRIKKIFGKKCHGHENHHHNEHRAAFTDVLAEHGFEHEPRVGRAPVWVREHRDGHAHGGAKCQMKKHGHHKKKSFKKLRKAVKRVRKANEKLVAFERGFISKDGIKDREWYKHLAVAPGKWLGK